jgi:hypothetical protein
MIEFGYGYYIASNNNNKRFCPQSYDFENIDKANQFLQLISKKQNTHIPEFKIMKSPGAKSES